MQFGIVLSHVPLWDSFPFLSHNCLCSYFCNSPTVFPRYKLSFKGTERSESSGLATICGYVWDLFINPLIQQVFLQRPRGAIHWADNKDQKVSASWKSVRADHPLCPASLSLLPPDLICTVGPALCPSQARTLPTGAPGVGPSPVSPAQRDRCPGNTRGILGTAAFRRRPRLLQRPLPAGGASSLLVAPRARASFTGVRLSLALCTGKTGITHLPTALTPSSFCSYSRLDLKSISI